jgi:hypothetical protein
VGELRRLRRPFTRRQRKTAPPSEGRGSRRDDRSSFVGGDLGGRQARGASPRGGMSLMACAFEGVVQGGRRRHRLAADSVAANCAGLLSVDRPGSRRTRRRNRLCGAHARSPSLSPGSPSARSSRRCRLSCSRSSTRSQRLAPMSAPAPHHQPSFATYARSNVSPPADAARAQGATSRRRWEVDKAFLIR